MKASTAFLLVIIIQIFVCSPFISSAQQYEAILHQNTASGQLSATQYDSILHLLQRLSSQSLKDTVVVKYQYQAGVASLNAEQTDDIIQQNLTNELRFLHNYLVKRKNISIYNLIEPGPKADSILLINNMANIDTANSVHRLLFDEKNSFNSVILLPNRKYICFSSAEGWAALQVTGGELQQLLASSTHNITKN